MENASKALLIAGAVLIVILLIGIGMLIYSRSTGVVDTAANSMNAQQIQAFNSQFTPYQGDQPGSSVKALINTVIANNNSSANKVKVGTAETSSDLANIDITPTKTYTVAFVYGSKGLIETINVTEKTTTTQSQ